MRAETHLTLIAYPQQPPEATLGCSETRRPAMQHGGRDRTVECNDLLLVRRDLLVSVRLLSDISLGHTLYLFVYESRVCKAGRHLSQKREGGVDDA